VRRRLAVFLGAATVLVAMAGAGMLAGSPNLRAKALHRLFGDVPNSVALLGSTGDVENVLVRVDARAAGRPISPYIYGVAGADAQVMRELGATLNRWGGNPSSRYNWVNGHAWNAGRDWEFRNVNYLGSDDSAADLFVAEALATGVVPLMTVPMIGWVAKSGRNEIRSVGVPVHGGPAIRPGSAAIAGYDPAPNRQLTSVVSLPRKPGPMVDHPDPASTTVYQDEWIHHLVTRFAAQPAAVSLIAMDNEPDLWSETHADVHPVRMGYEDMFQAFESYATAAKAQAPFARVLGPDVSGWTSYEYSALDRGTDNFRTHADRLAHGDQPFLAWWLARVAREDKTRGMRSLDLLDVHFYPQAPGVDSPARDAATQTLRIRSTRSLYDPSYVDESWIDQPVMLIPRLKSLIAQNYPGTGLAITEYRWGGEGDVSGAVALAQALGIFGREGVDVASYWRFPKPSSPAGAAFRLYGNFDGRGSRFGDVSLPATSNRSDVSVFAARNSKTSAIDLMLVNGSLVRAASVGFEMNIATAAIKLYQVPGGSADIVEKELASLRAPLSLSPGSVTLVHIVPSSRS
jgi:hypothetical protein